VSVHCSGSFDVVTLAADGNKFPIIGGALVRTPAVSAGDLHNGLVGKTVSRPVAPLNRLAALLVGVEIATLNVAPVIVGVVEETDKLLSNVSAPKLGNTKEKTAAPATQTRNIGHLLRWPAQACRYPPGRIIVTSRYEKQHPSIG
jgi:hypothetical protein